MSTKYLITHTEWCQFFFPCTKLLFLEGETNSPGQHKLSRDYGTFVLAFQEVKGVISSGGAPMSSRMKGEFAPK